VVTGGGGNKRGGGQRSLLSETSDLSLHTGLEKPREGSAGSLGEEGGGKPENKGGKGFRALLSVERGVCSTECPQRGGLENKMT